MTVTPAIPVERIPVAFKRLLLIMLFALAVMTVGAQQMVGFLEFNGRTKKSGKDLPGATITLYRNGVKQKEIVTGRSGKFRLDIDFGADYKVTFAAPGCVDMHLLIFASNIPKEKSSIFPIYDIEVPFFDVNDKTIRTERYKKPFTKIVFDGNRTFRDDEAYLEDFVKDIHVDPDEIQKQMEEKERLEREKMLALEKEKDRLAREKQLAEEKARLEAEEKRRAEELARLKRENEESIKNIEGVSMETEAIRLQREKEEKAVKEKKNRGIKSTYESELLKTVAENERIAKEKELKRLRTDAQTNAVIEKIKNEIELKAKSEYLREQEKEKNKKALQNKQIKSQQVKKLVEAAAFADRSVKVNKQTRLPDPKEYKAKKLPNVAVSYEEGFFKSTSTVTVTFDKKVVVFKKEIYTWGATYYYKDDVEIDEGTFKKEVIKYGPYTPKQ